MTTRLMWSLSDYNPDVESVITMMMRSLSDYNDDVESQ